MKDEGYTMSSIPADEDELIGWLQRSGRQIGLWDPGTLDRLARSGQAVPSPRRYTPSGSPGGSPRRTAPTSSSTGKRRRATRLLGLATGVSGSSSSPGSTWGISSYSRNHCVARPTTRRCSA